jgi:predicted Rdx family selenoprotein
VTDAYYPLVDTASDCTTGNCLYRDEWAKALSAAFGNAACNVPYSPITSCHFYDMDNEPEIWDGSHT